MDEATLARIAVLERRQKFLVITAVLAFWVVGAVTIVRPQFAKAQDKAETKTLTVSELVIVDSTGKARVRLGGNLPEAVVEGKTMHRERAAGILLYDGTGVERGGYVTFEPSGNIALTLDTRKRQVALFVAGPDDTGTSALQLFSPDSAVELRNDEDGPSIHAVRHKQVVFHEPLVENPESTEMCKALQQAKGQANKAELLEACRARTSEAACQACLSK